MTKKYAVLNGPDKMHQVSLGCVIDGSHWSTHDFNVKVISLAVEYGMDLNTEDAQLFYDWSENLSDSLRDADFEVSLEMADEAEAWLNEHTEHGYVWHVEEQSLFLSRSADLDEDVVD